jgi:hypothetical protein
MNIDKSNSPSNTKLTREGFFEFFDKAEKIKTEADNILRGDLYANLKHMEKLAYDKLSNFEGYLPSFSFSEIHPKLEGKDVNPRSISFPHIKGVASFQVKGISKRLNVFIGRLEEFHGGKLDNRVIEIAKDKVFDYLLKNHSDLFTLEDKDGFISKKQFLEEYERREKAITTLDFYRKKTGNEESQRQMKLKDLQELKDEFFIPDFQFSEIFPKTEGRDDKSRSIDFPHIKCSAVYNMLGEKKRLSIYIGPLDKFTHGKNDTTCVEIAKNKIFDHYLKKYPMFFA